MPVPPQGMSHPPLNWYEALSAPVLRRMANERNDALCREELHRQSMNATSTSSLHNGYLGYESNEGSSHGGYWADSSANS
jgi:hypothetical protein